MQSDQFFTNENLIKCLGYPSSFHVHDRQVHSLTKEEEYELLQCAKRIEEENSKWLKEI